MRRKINLTILLLLLIVSCNKDKKHNKWIIGRWKSEVINGNYHIYEFKDEGLMCTGFYYANPDLNSPESCDEYFNLVDSFLIVTVIGSNNTDTLHLIFNNEDSFTVKGMASNYNYTRIE